MSSGRATLMGLLMLLATCTQNGKANAPVPRAPGVSVRAKSAVALIIAADLRDGELQAVSSGSGTIVDTNGLIITNHHVLFDAAHNKLHDFFIVGLFRDASVNPELVCVGVPSQAKLKPNVDLALIRCDRDRFGAPWQAEHWPSLPHRSGGPEIQVGDKLWVLGYPAVGKGGIYLSSGLVSGWSAEHGGTGSRAFLKTNAAISYGNSGGAAIDQDGYLVGIPTAFRRTSTPGEVIASRGRVGLIRPLHFAQDWLDGHQPLRQSVRTGKVIDEQSGRPVESARVIVLKAGFESVDTNNLAARTLTWKSTDSAGIFQIEEVLLSEEDHVIVVVAEGYLSLLHPRVEQGDVISLQRK